MESVPHRLVKAISEGYCPEYMLRVADLIEKILDEDILTHRELNMAAMPLLAAQGLDGRVPSWCWRQAIKEIRRAHGAAAVPAAGE